MSDVDLSKNILVVGDLHGDWGSLNTLINDKKPNILMQVGDFGWWPAMEVTKPVIYGHQKEWLLQGIKPQNSRIYWCDGNHEQHPHLSQDRHLTEMYDRVTFCSRGSTIVLPDERVVMFMGGADSIDKKQRTAGHDWFPDENISQWQLQRAMEYEGRVDIIISHTCPLEFNIEGNEGKRNDSNRVALSRLLEKYKPELWYFGHWHKNKKGKHNGTYWECLDYPKHGGKWWDWLK